jgi:hypothetical protein
VEENHTLDLTTNKILKDMNTSDNEFEQYFNRNFQSPLSFIVPNTTKTIDKALNPVYNSHKLESQHGSMLSGIDVASSTKNAKKKKLNS